MNYQGQKEFLEFYEDHIKRTRIELEKYSWSIGEFYKFFVKGFRGIITANAEKGEGRYTGDFNSFTLDEEDLKYLYDKYKPLVEKYNCTLKKKELATKERNLARYQKEIEKLKQEQCNDT